MVKQRICFDCDIKLNPYSRPTNKLGVDLCQRCYMNRYMVGNKIWLGKKHTKETKNILSLQKKGKPSPNKGKHHTDETKEKISFSNTGRKRTEETCKKISDSKKGKPSHNKGKPMLEEQKNKISKTLTGNIILLDTRKKYQKHLKVVKSHCVL